MDNRYSLLTERLREAAKIGREFAAKVGDGGSANLDAVFLKLKGFREKQTVDAIHAAGLSGFKTTWVIGDGFLIDPPAVGQGNKRARAQEAMVKSLEAFCPAFSYYRLD